MSIRLLARSLAGVGLCVAALSAAAGPYSSLVVFGDSISDSGNNAHLMSFMPGGVPQPPITGNDYYSRFPLLPHGTYSNGDVWTTHFAASLGLTLTPAQLGGTNFAHGGAQTGLDGSDVPALPGFPYSMRTQLNWYLGATGNVADPNALYVVAGGGNNVRAALEAIALGADPVATAAATVTNYASDMAGLVASLKGAGAQHVLVLDTPNFGLTPLANAMGVSAAATALSWEMDNALAGALAGSGVKRFDMFSFLTNAVAVAPALGFTNWTDACGVAGGDCSSALFWDGIHPTALGHQQLAAAVLAVAVPEPDVSAMLALGLFVVALGARRRAAVQQG